MQVAMNAFDSIGVPVRIVDMKGETIETSKQPKERGKSSSVTFNSILCVCKGADANANKDYVTNLEADDSHGNKLNQFPQFIVTL